MQKLVQHLILFLMASILAACDLGTGYREKNGGYIFVTLDEGRGYVEHPIKDADAKTFRILNKYTYAKDSQRVYYKASVVPSADPNTFTTLSDLYGKDAAHVYYDGKTISGANPAWFSPIDTQWGKDESDFYFQNRALQTCDPVTFAFLKDNWQRDIKCVYKNGGKLPNADSGSFVVLNGWFGKDKNNVYYSTKILQGADAATFKIKEGACEVCGQDKNGCYHFDKQVDCTSLK